MATRELGIILHGATGGICSFQHLRNSLVPIINEGGLKVGGERILPKLLLVSRNEERLSKLAAEHDGLDWTTDLDAALRNADYPVFFDAAATHLRVGVLERAIAAGKHIYTEKPVAPSVQEGMSLLRAAKARGLKHGAVEDKLFLPGFLKLRRVVESGFSGAGGRFSDPVRLVGVQWYRGGMPAPELELQKRRVAEASSRTCTPTGATSSRESWDRLRA